MVLRGREQCISALMQVVAQCGRILKEMGFEQYEAGPEQALLEE
jgi:hypothetical protein